jgi:hypothetical protein
MAPLLTGRSVLKFLHIHGGESTIATVASTFDVDSTAIERLVRSLLAARLVGRSADHLTLSEAGKSWCREEFKPAIDTIAEPVVAAASSSAGGRHTLEAHLSSEKSPMPRNANRMHGVQVLHVTRRRESMASAAPATPLSSRNLPPARQDPEAEPAAVVVREKAEKATAPVVPRTESHPDTALPPRVVVDRDGFVTQINGRRIF